jgi:hypothetical protein
MKINKKNSKRVVINDKFVKPVKKVSFDLEENVKEKVDENVKGDLMKCFTLITVTRQDLLSQHNKLR